MKARYDLGECPTSEEWSAYCKCERYMDAESVVSWLECEEVEVTQDEFDTLVHRFNKCAHDGFGDTELIGDIYNDVIGR